MMLLRLSFLLLIVFFVGCANIVPPEGGKKDEIPPKLVSIEPGDSLLNKRVTNITLHFDEFIVLKDPTKEVQVSPVLPFPVSVTSVGKKVKVSIPDSLLQNGTTYRVSFGKAIRDLHEDNVFEGYSYTFSTGSYFDSLQLSGVVTNAANGSPADGVNVLLHYASSSDSAIVRKKPAYITKTNANGVFVFAGLPNKSFKLYALKDENENLIYDGGEEQIAFFNKVITPTIPINDTVSNKLLLFKEIISDTFLAGASPISKGLARKRGVVNDENFRYSVLVDTNNVNKRTLDITDPLTVKFNKDTFSYNAERIFVTMDSAGIDVEVDFTVSINSIEKDELLIKVKWKKDKIYTIRFLTGFANDTSGADITPSKYIFRTKNDDDYGKLTVRLPSKYLDEKYVLQVNNKTDTVYKQRVTDTTINLSLLPPDTYNLYLIVDENKNGVWDAGILLDKKQPEVVIPHSTDIILKAGWENVEDFVDKDNAHKPQMGQSPNKGDVSTNK